MDLGFVRLNALRRAKFEEFTYLLGSCFCSTDKEQILEYSKSILWFTYRTNFAAIGGDGPTTDRGWGCMLRCGQMILAHALSVVHLGRGWKWKNGSTNANYRRLLRMFQDKRGSLFSLQQIAQMGVSEGKAMGEWFGPATISQCLKKLVIYDGWSRMAVHVAMDNILIASDVRTLATLSWEDGTESEEKRQKMDDDAPKQWRPVLILIPLRLGLSSMQREYLKAIQEFFKLPQCAGILGGRPNHAVYFTGISGEELYYLDPHTAQPTVDLESPRSSPSPASNSDERASSTEQDNCVLLENADPVIELQSNEEIEDSNKNTTAAHENPQEIMEDGKRVEKRADNDTGELSDESTESFEDSSYHCSDLQYMNIDSLDPSLALGFICSCEDDFNDLITQLKEKILAVSKPPMFGLVDERPKGWPSYVPYTRPGPSTATQETEFEDFSKFDSDDDFEILQ